MDVSFGTIWEAVARRLPDAVAVSEPGRAYTYAEFEERAARLAAGFVAAGVGAGDKVACYLYNGAAYLEVVFAAFKIGAVPVNVNYRYGGDELAELLTDADAAALVFSGELAGNVAYAAATVSTLRLLIRVGDAPGGGTGEGTGGGAGGGTGEGAGGGTGEGGGGGPGEEVGGGPEVIELAELLAANEPLPAAPRPGTDQLFMYTGGTTGRPKGVIWRLADLLHSLVVPIFRPLGVPELPGTLAEAVEIAVRANTAGRAPVTLPVVPLMHATGLFNSMGALLVGGRVVTTRAGGLDARHVWETVAEQRVGTLIVAGNAVCRPLVEELGAAERAGRPYDLGALKSMISSGTAMSDRLKRALHERADVTIIDAIASSEGGPFAFAITSSTGDLPARFFPVPATKVITAADTEVVPGSGEIGVLAYSGPMPLGYHNDTAKTSATYRIIGGVRYAIPGDLVQVEADGAIRFLGRGSGVINTGGEKVHPQEVENALLSHPDVTDCVVVGVPDETWGERVSAVVATPGEPVTEKELQDWVRRGLAGYKVPRTIVFLPALQRTPTGKVEVSWARRTVQEKQLDGD